jgi:hypothetical protein
VMPSQTKAGSMHLTELSTEELRDAGNALETLIDLREWLPPGDMFLERVSKLRDDIRELLALPAAPRVSCGAERKMLADMKDADVDRLVKALNTLMSRFEDCIEDAELWRHLATVLSALGFELVERTMKEGARAS